MVILFSFARVFWVVLGLDFALRFIVRKLNITLVLCKQHELVYGLRFLNHAKVEEVRDAFKSPLIKNKRRDLAVLFIKCR